MLEDDVKVATYRDAVIWLGAVVKLTAREAGVVCNKIVKARSVSTSVKKLVAVGLFVLDDMKGALLAIPRNKECVKAVAGALRAAGLSKVATRLSRAARKVS